MNDPYKSLFKGIVIFLLIVVVGLVVSIMLSGCHSKKSLTRESTETAQAVTVASQDLAAIERQRLDHTFTITLDDLELYFPADVPLEDVALLQGNDSDSLVPAPLQTRDARRAPVRLKARSAVISSAATAETTSAVVAHQQDSTTTQQSSQEQVRQSGEVTTVAHPVPPWIYLVLALVMGAILFYKFRH